MKDQATIARRHIEELRCAAIAKGITQAVIAERTGFRENHISRMLSGRYIPRYDNFLKLCEAVGVKIILK